VARSRSDEAGRGFDATQRLIVKEWGLLVPMRSETHRLEDYTAVTLGALAGDLRGL
jgi:hypothetical protein